MQSVLDMIGQLLIQDPTSIAVLFLGWPALITSLALAGIGIFRRKPALLLVSFVLVLPLSYYLLGANNWLGWLAPLLPLSCLVFWYTNRKELAISPWLQLGILAIVPGVLVYYLLLG